MSMLWAPQNPRGFPVYGYKGKAGYSLMNSFDPKASGAMVVVGLPEGRPLWIDQIRDNFLHPSSESMATYSNVVLGDDGEDETDFNPAPTRGEPILLLSEESVGSYQDLIHRSTREGPQRGAAQEHVVEGVATPVVDLQAGVTEQVETRKKKKEERSEKKTAEKSVAETPRKRPSNSSALDYVRKILEDKKRELGAQAAAVLSEKKSKFMKESAVAPSESEIDLGVFSKKTGNRLEKIFKSSSAPQASSKSTHSGPKIDISKITPPASPPSRPLDLSPPHLDPKGKGKEDEIEVDQSERVVENVAAGAGGADVHAEVVETEWESSEATPQGTVYTKHMCGSGGDGASGGQQGLEFHRV
ncbi:hypothetical protein HanPI659440_Chr15g0605611 [Helianthus annuus]|nr:hypothetical protein HanPI659440_Chr15g0605611 [Helianthus annuus]